MRNATQSGERVARVVILQTSEQSRHYSKYKQQPGDIVIPIGPEALHYAEKLDWRTCRLGELWKFEDYFQAARASKSRIDSLIEALDEYSVAWNPAKGLQIGRYYAFQLWMMIGQIHYNLFIARSIVEYLNPVKVLVYSKENGKPFLTLRPDPDCIFADVLLGSRYFAKDQIEKQTSFEATKGNTLREKILQALPQKWLEWLRTIRMKWLVHNAGHSKYKILLIGGGYDWVKISKFREFGKKFRLCYRSGAVFVPSTDAPTVLVRIINGYVSDENLELGYVEGLASSIHSDLNKFASTHDKIMDEMSRYDAVVTSVLAFPWDNYLAHMAEKSDLPVVVWQHGEKGQSEDEAAMYTELFYASSYFAYASAVSLKYKAWIGKNRLSNVEITGSLGKSIVWRGGETIVYATGKWLKTATPFTSASDPDARLFTAHKIILNYLEMEGIRRPIVFKANNTAGLNTIPYKLKNIRIEYSTPFTVLLETARLIILDTPATTLIEACSTKVPIFALDGRARYLPEFLELVKRRVVWCETPDELVNKVNLFLDSGTYEADVNDTCFLSAYGPGLTPNEVIERVNENLERAIESYKSR